MRQDELIPHLFRTEYSKIVAVLYHSYKLAHLEVAEDIASETFLKATEVWSIKGIPENPTAWLYVVARNKVKDHFKHHSVFERHVKDISLSDNIEAESYFEFSKQNISDSQLAMIFSVCDPANSAEAQICLALQILCGFSVEEIANAFLSKTETIKKRLLRARANLCTNNFKMGALREEQIKTRLDNVLKTLYLLFNEGYSSKTNNQQVRKDLCAEALRLAYVLSESPLTNTSQTNALLALICFQSSRLDARTDEKGNAILFEDQDRNLWNQELVDKGNYYLVHAYNGHEVSKYHLEAAIAYWHSTSTDKDKKWPPILELYNRLILVEYSPITALNRTFAYANVYGHERAIAEARKLSLTEHCQYYSLLGYLYAKVDVSQAVAYYQQAMTLTKSKTELQTLTKEIERLVTSRAFPLANASSLPDLIS